MAKQDDYVFDDEEVGTVNLGLPTDNQAPKPPTEAEKKISDERKLYEDLKQADPNTRDQMYFAQLERNLISQMPKIADLRKQGEQIIVEIEKSSDRVNLLAPAKIRVIKDYNGDHIDYDMREVRKEQVSNYRQSQGLDPKPDSAKTAKLKARALVQFDDEPNT